MLRHNRDDLDGHTIRVRVVASDELHTAFKELGSHEYVARQPVKPSDDEDSPQPSSVRENPNKLRSIL